MLEHHWLIYLQKAIFVILEDKVVLVFPELLLPNELRPETCHESSVAFKYSIA